VRCAGAALAAGVDLFQDDGQQDQGDADGAEEVERGQAQLVETGLADLATNGL
jgi:hypothetical protein